MAGTSAHWGSSAVGFLKGVAQIIASVAVAAVGLWVIGQVAPEFSQQAIDYANHFWREIPNYFQQGVDFFKGLWTDLNSSQGLITRAGEFAQSQWNNNAWVRGTAAVSAVGIGAYAAGSLLDGWQSRVGHKQQPPSSFEMKEMARRIRASQENGHTPA